MKALKWSRGLLRLWIFLSAIWVSIMFFVVEPYQAYFRMSEARKELLGDDGIFTKDELLAAASRAEAANDEDSSQQLTNLADQLEEGATFESESSVELARAKSSFMNAVLAIFAPVGISFLMGAGALWVGRGFRN
jgi:hypothetical protein